MFGSRSGSVAALRHGWMAPFAGLLLIGGCATGGVERRAWYNCDGRQVSVVFSGGVARVFDGPGSPFVLDRRHVRNGFWYESATRSIRGSGRNMTYTIGMMAPLQCRKTGSGRW